MNYVVITPVRNEADYVGRTIDAMAAQTVLPSQWVIVDDGSTDGTQAILVAAAERHPWITVVRRRDRGFRKSGGGVVEAFEEGRGALRGDGWKFLVKLDGDVKFEPDYFERCFRHFAEDPNLGIAGGIVYVLEAGSWKVDSPGDPPFHVRGATKIYRHDCWKAISPLEARPGWDTVDEVRANMNGWGTRSLPDVALYQQRATGAVDGAWRNWVKNGVANYVTGYHPLFMAGKCLKRAWGIPPVVPGVALWVGYCSGYLKRLPRMEDRNAIRYLRNQQLRRLAFRYSIYDSGGKRRSS